MAGVDFGDSELFQQLDDSAPPLPTHIRFTDDEGDQEETSQLRSRLEECDDYIQKLTEENKVLQRKLNILTRPSGITVEDVNIDGPLLQILYSNNTISKKCRQEIEDCICSVILKHHKPGNEKKKSSSFHIKPQSSAFAMDEDLQKLSSSSVRTTTEAFKVVGSVLYFTTFSVDKLGQPLVNENPQLTDGWDVPTYHQVFNQVIGTDGQEIEMKDKRPKSMCFNCGSSAHQMRDCPKPKDMAAINERRKEFNQNSNQAMQSNQRYHADEVEERFAKYKPGVMSEELLSALGIDGNTLPPLIYRMRQLGYPPGWLKEAEMENSGLSLYDGNVSNDGSVPDSSTSQNISYDVSKLVDFPGFNVSASHKMKDEFMQYGSIPMQSSHMKQNYAAYLSNNFPMPGATCNKRRHDADSSPQQRKKTRSSPDRHSDRSSDMDIESDPGTPYHHQAAGDFKFQPPLPPGSPCFSSPPPLPQGTPPATPTPPPLPKGTPPPTPTNGSPALRGRNWAGVDETAEGAEDDLTLEELEEQQRLIWAALENADTATNSDCDTPAVGTPAHVDTEPEEAEEAMDTMKSAEPCQSNETQKEPSVQETFSESPGPIKVEDDSPQSPEPVKATDDNPQSPPPVKSHDDSPQSPDPVRCLEDNPQSPNADFPNPEAGDASPKNVEKITAVPDRSKFAAGIVPFEDTPEFTEVAEATGTYLRIRDLLKSSPRSLAKKK
ncbi:zinc finger CCHC domain-containing protein 8 [Stegastes partitus]|uniref:Zinc finger CCHC domain-containing protein 8 n=1 Tax=Stegastes partitus TaxID=144197 RepID=A0A9Y4KF11_9TELE|nr:PREDICTED: zinc finger CCHC domain-containing protein 8 [Stegastes partitus]